MKEIRIFLLSGGIRVSVFPESHGHFERYLAAPGSPARAQFSPRSSFYVPSRDERLHGNVEDTTNELARP